MAECNEKAPPMAGLFVEQLASCPLRLLAVECVLQALARLERGVLGRGDFHALAGLRIAARAGSPLLDFEGAETDQRNSVARLQGGGDRVDSGIQGAGGDRFGQVSVGSNLIDQLGFFHVYTLVDFQIGPSVDSTGRAASSAQNTPLTIVETNSPR